MHAATWFALDDELKKIATDLTESARDKIKPKNFAEPKKRAYPIEDPAHARNALARVSQFGSPGEKSQVRAKVHAKYPGIGDDKEKKSSMNMKGWQGALKTTARKAVGPAALASATGGAAYLGARAGSKKEQEKEKKSGLNSAAIGAATGGCRDLGRKVS